MEVFFLQGQDELFYASLAYKTCRNDGTSAMKSAEIM